MKLKGLFILKMAKKEVISIVKAVRIYKIPNAGTVITVYK